MAEKELKFRNEIVKTAEPRTAEDIAALQASKRAAMLDAIRARGNGVWADALESNPEGDVSMAPAQRGTDSVE